MVSVSRERSSCLVSLGLEYDGKGAYSPIEKNPYMTVHCSVFFEGGVDISYPQWKAVVPVDVDYLSLSRYPSSFSFTLQTFVRHLSHFP